LPLHLRNSLVCTAALLVPDSRHLSTASQHTQLASQPAKQKQHQPAKPDVSAEQCSQKQYIHTSYAVLALGLKQQPPHNNTTHDPTGGCGVLYKHTRNDNVTIETRTKKNTTSTSLNPERLAMQLEGGGEQPRRLKCAAVEPESNSGVPMSLLWATSTHLIQWTPMFKPLTAQHIHQERAGQNTRSGCNISR